MKKKRHETILDLIREYEIENQTELANKLNELGYDVTQATVSRDIQKLNLIKVKSNNKFKYTIIENVKNYEKKYVTIMQETIKTVDTAKNFVIVKTQSGMAMATAAAIDGFEFNEIVGSIAGDDVIFIATKSDDDAMILLNKIEVYIRKES